MARRSDHTREELREMTISEGSTLLAEGGLARFSARGLAVRIGYTVGTLYNVFDDYDDMLLHINARTLDDLYQALEGVSASSRTPQAALKALTLAYLAFAKAHTHRWRTLFAHHMADGRMVPEWYEQKLAALFMLVEEPLHALIGDAAVVEARALWAAIHGVCALGVDGKLALPGVCANMDEAALLLLERYLAGARA